MTYNEAIEINNHGIRLYERLRYEEARNMFTLALDILRDAMVEQTEKQSPEYEELSDALLLWGDSREESNPSTATNCSSFIFQSAIVIVPMRRHSHLYGKESAAIVYNLGLVQHMMGVKMNSTVHLKQAVSFYTISCSIQHSSKVCDEPLLRMALLNNLGQIHVEFSDFRNAVLCFQRLSDELERSRETFLLADTDCKGFLYNILLQEPSVAGAA